MSVLNRIALSCLLLLIAPLSCSSRNSAPPKAAATPPHPVILRLCFRTRDLTVTKSPHGPLYSLSDKAGHILLAESSLDQIQQRDPDLYQWINSATCAVTTDSAR